MSADRIRVRNAEANKDRTATDRKASRKLYAYWSEKINAAMDAGASNQEVGELIRKRTEEMEKAP